MQQANSSRRRWKRESAREVRQNIARVQQAVTKGEESKTTVKCINRRYGKATLIARQGMKVKSKPS